MTIIVVLFNLKPGVDAAAYEQWAKEKDLPHVNALPAVRQFSVLKSLGLMGGGAGPYQYVEIIDVHSVEKLRADVRSETMMAVAREFRQFADSPQFIVTEAVG
jgi:hypothetical protein